METVLQCLAAKFHQELVQIVSLVNNVASDHALLNAFGHLAARNAPGLV